MKILFTDTGWDDYTFWLDNDTKVLKKIHRLLKDIDRSPFDGLGKPEPLKFELTGYWSRRVNKDDRLVYKVEKGTIIVIACKSHYQ
ncbi:MAG TPA: Txe/YoeB family addiction module toxin [Dehalococcoidales bacterium]|nr:Txe/YoeB family addiction module toxin [Dehalococcoidales bacterium]